MEKFFNNHSNILSKNSENLVAIGGQDLASKGKKKFEIRTFDHRSKERMMNKDLAFD